MSFSDSLSALRHSLPQLTLQVLDDLDAMVYIKTLDGHYVWGNRVLLDAVGRTGQDLAGVSDSDLADAATVQLFREEDLRVQQTRDVLRTRREVVFRGTGERRVYQALKRPLFDPYGSVVAIAGVSTDVTYETRTERRLHTLLTLTADWYWEQDAEGRFTAFSSLIENAPVLAIQREAYGRKRWEIDGLQPLGADWSEHQRAYAQAQAFRDFEYQRTLADGRELTIAVSGEPLRNHEGELIGWRGVGRDVTSAVRQRRALETSEASRRSTLLAIPDLLYEFDADGRYVHMQAPAEVSHIVVDYQSIGKRLEDVLPAEVAQIYRNAMARAARFGVVRRVEYSLELPDGRHWFEDSISARRDPVTGALAGYVALIRDVTEARQARAELERQLQRDPLTGLPTQYAMLQTLDDLLAAVEPGQTPGSSGLVFCKIEPADFRLLVTRFGHKVADELLCLIAHRLRHSLWQDVRWARAPGSSFLALAPQGSSVLAQGARPWIDRLFELLQPAFDLSIGPLSVHFALGVFVQGQSGNVAHGEEVLRATELALDEARSGAGLHAVIYEPERGQRILAAIQLKTELALAVSQSQLRLHWQSIVDDQGLEVAREALVRWQHPQRGLLSPAEFIPLAEETNLILAIGQWVLKTAILQRCAWVLAAGPEAHQVPIINVNVSARQVQQGDFAQQVRGLLQEHGCPPEALQLEITEGLLMQDSKVILEQLQELRGLGVAIALDDFGTGFSCLSYLQRLPLTCLKIDRSFVSQLQHDSGTEAVVRTIIALAEGLKLAVVAEGVETEGQRDALQALGVRRFQGFLFGKPREISTPSQ